MRSFHDSAAPSNNALTVGIFQYTNSDGGLINNNPSLVNLPLPNDTIAASGFVGRIKNARVRQNPRMNVPRRIDRRVYVAISTSSIACPECNMNGTGTRFVGALNNNSFILPSIDILQAYYNRDRIVMVSEDFSFPRISNPLPEFTSLPSLWRVTSLVYPEFGDDNEEKEQEPPVSFQRNKRDTDDVEKMDMLWEELESHEELKRDSSLAQGHAMIKIYHKKQSKSLLTVMKIKMFYLRNLISIKN